VSEAAVVLDASALMALLNTEPGADEVEVLAADAAISAITWCEAYGKLRGRGVDSAALTANMAESGITIHSFDERDARDTGELAPLTRGAGLSLADRACLALAARLGVPAITADRAWTDLDVGVEIRCIR
jgi:PIN domain nuclease of toxin-antitoxin system